MARRVKHGESSKHTITPEYKAWYSMMQRCYYHNMLLTKIMVQEE